MTRVVALAWICAAAAACGGERETTAAAPEPERPASTLPDPPSAEPGCALDDAPARHLGVSPALAAGALVLHRDGQAVLVRTEAPPAAETVDPSPTDGARPLGTIRVPPAGLAARGDGWLLAAQTDAGPTALLLDGDGAVADRIPLAATGSLTDAAVAVAGDRGWIAWSGDDGSLRLAVIDLLAEQLEVTHALADARVGPPRIAATRRAAHVTVAGAIAPVWSARAGGGGATRTVSPGVPHDLFAAREEIALVHGQADRTGAWLTRGRGTHVQFETRLPNTEDFVAVRVTTPRAQAEQIAAAPLSDGAVLVYRSRGDVWVQRIDEDGVRGEPVVLGAAGSGAPRVAANGQRFWAAWEDGDHAVVRGGVCLAVDH